MSEDRVQRVAQAISAQMGGTTFAKLAEAMLDAVPEIAELDRLTTELHKQRAHPDFEYTVTITGRKTGEEGRPDGEGWEPNNAMFGDRNWDRDDYTENNHWMRPVSFLRAEQAVGRDEATTMATNFRNVGGMLHAWQKEAEELVDRERFTDEAPMGVGLNKTWHRIISNALGHPELPARLGPLFVLQLNAVLGMAADQLERHPEKREEGIYMVLHDLARQLFQADLEITRKA